MKLRLIYVLLVFLLLNSLFVLGEISLDSLPDDTFNLGDQVVVSGTIDGDEDMRAYLTLDLVCSSSSSQLWVRSFDLRAGLEASFARLIVIPKVDSEDCKIVARLNEGSDMIDTEETSPFEISNELKGAFDLVDSVYQLGESIDIRGGITKLDGTPVNGVAMLYFKNEGSNVLVENVDVINGDLMLDKELKLMPSGSYEVDVEVSDSSGNSFVFENALDFDLLGNLNLDVDIDKQSYLPGTDVLLKGVVRSSVAQSALEGVKVIASLGDLDFEQELGSGDFEMIYQLPSNIKSGGHNLGVIVKDEDGNYAEQSFMFDVNAVATTLSMKLDNAEFNPGEKVDFDVLLFDQADDPMPGSVSLYVYDGAGKLRAEQNVVVNKKATFTLPEQASPGAWQVRLGGFDLGTEQSFVIKEVKKLDVIVEDGKFKIRNIGNVDFEGPVNFIADGVEKVRNVVLSPSGEQEIHLADLFEEGVHTIEVPLIEKVFESVEIIDDRTLLDKVGGGLGLSGVTGKAVGNKGGGSWWAVVLVLCLVIGGLVVGGVMLSRTKTKDEGSHTHTHSEGWDKDYSLGRKRAKQLGRVEVEKPVKKRKYNFGKASEADVVDFKRRMVKMVQDEEAQRKKLASRKWQQPVPRQSQSPGFMIGGSKPEFKVENPVKEKKEEDGPFKSLFG